MDQLEMFNLINYWDHCAKCHIQESKDNKLFESPDPHFKPWICMRCIGEYEKEVGYSNDKVG